MIPPRAGAPKYSGKEVHNCDRDAGDDDSLPVVHHARGEELAAPRRQSPRAHARRRNPLSYDSFELDVRRRQTDMRAASARMQLARSLRASRRPEIRPLQVRVARALHAVADRLEASTARPT